MLKFLLQMAKLVVLAFAISAVRFFAGYENAFIMDFPIIALFGIGVFVITSAIIRLIRSRRSG